MNQMGHVFNGFAIQGQEICNKDSKTSLFKLTNNNNYKRLEPYLDKGFLIFVVYFGSTNFRIFLFGLFRNSSVLFLKSIFVVVKF